MHKKKIHKIIADKIIYIAEKQVKDTIYRSWPLGLYEEKVPEEVDRYFKEKELGN
ncbi:hypothetical protein LJC58_01950 [Lachnospiraceae bacterium OttesenSCG-928-D06]|nr:hypothetical protein [Lachnospiraceae bacterium OttesenSCG-928-D06]